MSEEMKIDAFEVMSNRYARIVHLFSEVLRLLTPTEDEVKAFNAAIKDKMDKAKNPEPSGHPV